jgi:hypothetical protein
VIRVHGGRVKTEISAGEESTHVVEDRMRRREFATIAAEPFRTGKTNETKDMGILQLGLTSTCSFANTNCAARGADCPDIFKTHPRLRHVDLDSVQFTDGSRAECFERARNLTLPRMRELAQPRSRKTVSARYTA